MKSVVNDVELENVHSQRFYSSFEDITNIKLNHLKSFFVEFPYVFLLKKLACRSQDWKVKGKFLNFIPNSGKQFLSRMFFFKMGFIKSKLRIVIISFN